MAKPLAPVGVRVERHVRLVTNGKANDLLIILYLPFDAWGLSERGRECLCHAIHSTCLDTPRPAHQCRWLLFLGLAP
jgi:hypothetical protein